jgi:hypothetical protein
MALWVNRVILAVGGLLPAFPRKRTSSGPAGMSQKCQYETLEMQEAVKPRDALFVCTPSSEQKSAPLLGARILLDIRQVDGVTFHE